MSPTHSTQAMPEGCPRCRALVLACWADGHPVRVDLQPVVRSGEIAAIREGLATYLLRRGYLQYRDNAQIAAERDYAPILIEHRCARPIPAMYWDTRSVPLVTASHTEGIPY